MSIGPSVHREELEPCYSCENGRRIYKTLGTEYIGESVVCLCPLKKKGNCACEDAQQIADRLTGVTE